MRSLFEKVRLGTSIHIKRLFGLQIGEMASALLFESECCPSLGGKLLPNPICQIVKMQTLADNTHWVSPWISELADLVRHLPVFDHSLSGNRRRGRTTGISYSESCERPTRPKTNLTGRRQATLSPRRRQATLSPRRRQTIAQKRIVFTVCQKWLY